MPMFASRGAYVGKPLHLRRNWVVRFPLAIRLPLAVNTVLSHTSSHQTLYASIIDALTSQHNASMTLQRCMLTRYKVNTTHY